MTNGARQGDVPTALTTSSGPGHNAWQMACAALVLFMTLLVWRSFTAAWSAARTCSPSWRSALVSPPRDDFSGGSLATASPFTRANILGTFRWAFLNGVDSTRTPDYGAWVFLFA